MANGEDKNKRIDFVITWVDCEDPMWQKMYTDFTGKELSGGGISRCLFIGYTQRTTRGPICSPIKEVYNP